jgi:predicted MFS family arabinose efflux permease
LVAAAVVLPENADPEAHRVDSAGAILGAAALAALIFGVMTGESTGFTAPAVLVLDLRFLRVAQFVVANVVAFCSYFATFAIFFFTALYLDEVAGYSGFRIALAFLPMTVLMITSSVLAGRWDSPTGLRWSVSAGCLCFAAGLLLTSATLRPQPNLALLAGALALTGAGIGWTVVPITAQSSARYRRNVPAWPHRRPTPAARSAPWPAWPCSARWSTRSCTPT